MTSATPRTLLFTGKGGVGKTTVAAATAALAAENGLRTLAISTDPAHSLADAFDVLIGAEPTPVADRLSVQQVDAQRSFERSWTAIQDYLLTVLDAVGVDPIAAEELTVLPGAEEVLALLELRAQVRSGRWDVVVVDCAPTAETLRLLALPESLGWYMDKVLPAERRVVRLLRPVLSRAAGVPMPRDGVFDAIEALHDDLSETRALLVESATSVRLVLTPERVVVSEARRSLTSLCLYGYRVDGVIANRIFPPGGDQWRQDWANAQHEVLGDVEASFAPMDIWRAAYGASEPIGVAALRDFARDLYAGADPVRLPTGRDPYEITRSEGATQVSLALPFAGREDVDLARHGDDLVVTVGAYRRIIALPISLRGAQVSRARVSGGRLNVAFSVAPTSSADAAHEGAS